MFFDFVGAAALAFAASAFACRVVIAAGVQDAPVLKRKAHEFSTPTSAGLAMGIGFAIGLCFLTFPPWREWSAYAQAGAARDAAAAVIVVFLFLAIGAVDDLRPLSPRLKFAMFTLASLAPPIAAGMRPDVFALGDGAAVTLPYAVAVIGSAMWVFTLVNCVNFMDGAHGLAMGSTAIGLFFLGVIALDLERVQTAALCFCAAAALVGFLVWNYPGGRLFAGDSGSLFAGAIAAVAGLLVVRNSGVSPLIPAVVFFPMLADVLLTLAWRVGRRANLLVGHREHFYQIGIRAGISHAHMTLIYWALASACGLIAVFAAAAGRGSWPFAFGLAGEAGLRVVVSYAPTVAFVVMVLAALVVDRRIRRFAMAKGFEEA
jgi:UDP-N-acetylmuramyl pentapeptide phosphotransferase/UDP-N-acetylglucosamine-1-phosphate transferase